MKIKKENKQTRTRTLSDGVLCLLMCLAFAVQGQAGDEWQHISHETQPLLPNNEIHFVKPGAEPGQVWVGTAAGAVELRDGVLRPLVASKDLSVWDVTADRDGGLWIGHDKGALCVKGETTTEALNGSVVVSIVPAGQALWALVRDPKTDEAQLLQLDGDQWKPIEAFKAHRVENLQLGLAGSVWVLLQSNGVLEVDPAKDLANATHHVPGVSVTSLLTDSKGASWLGTDGSGVIMVSGAAVPQYHLGDLESVVLGLAEDKAGRIWGATNRKGLWVYDGTKWDNLLKVERIELVKASDDGRVWSTIPQGAGLQCWDGTAWQGSLNDSGPVISLAVLPDNVLIAGTVFNGLYVLGTHVKRE